jgi:hypothetical protein
MSAISKQFIDFTSEIISDNYSIDLDDIKTKLSTKENKDKFVNFIKSNKIKQKKDKKESDEPEKFKTAYNLFSKDFRQNLVDENPGITIGETASLLGKKWEELKEKTPEIYNKYVDESNRQKAEYEEQMIQYRIDNNLPEKIKKVKKPKESAAAGDKSADDKAKNPFYYYLKENSVIVKNENPKMTQHNIYLSLREKWHESKRNKDEIFLKYKEIAKEMKNKSTAAPVSPAPSSEENDTAHSSAPSTPVAQKRNSPSPQSSPEEATPSPIKMKTPSPKKKSRMLSPGGLSPSKYLTSPPVVESSIKKKKSKKTKVSKKGDEKVKDKKKKKTVMRMIEVTDSSSDSDSD